MKEDRTYAYRDPNVRASDADREEIGDRLRRHHADGRIDAEEFQERLDSCYQAKTIDELRKLVADLPREHDDQARSPFNRRRWWLGPLVPILIAVSAISIVAGWHHGHHWGALWLIPLFLMVRFLVFPYGGWGLHRRGRYPRDL